MMRVVLSRRLQHEAGLRLVQRELHGDPGNVECQESAVVPDTTGLQPYLQTAGCRARRSRHPELA